MAVRLPNVASYVKNVGKSIAFASIDAVKANATGLKDFASSNEDAIKSTYASVKNFRQTLQKADRSIKQNKVYTAIEFGVKNMIEDIKTGNLYNTEREKSVADAALGLDDDDFDFSFETSFESNGSSTTGVKALSDSFDQSIGAAATVQTTAIAQGTDLVIKTNIASSKLIASRIDNMSSSLLGGLGSVYTSIDQVNRFLTGPMQSHLENAKMYFENSTKLLQEQAAMTKELLEMQRNLYKVRQAGTKQSNLSSSMSYNGSMNLEGYIKNVKSNIKNLGDMYGMGIGDMMDIGGGNPLLLYAAAPFKMILEPMIQGMMSKDLKNAIRSFDKGLTTLFSQVVARLNKKSNSLDGGIGSILGQIFGIRLDKKETINTANYEKGPVPFDGITRKTIIEVIPGYLARIESALTGREERHFDPYSGTWKSARRIEQEFKQEKAGYVASANASARYELQNLINETRAINTKAAESLEKSINNMFTKIYDDGGDFRPQMGKDPKKFETAAWKYYGFKSEKDFDNVMRNLSRNSIREMAYNNMSARESYASRMRDLEARGGSYNLLFSGAFDQTGTGKTTYPSVYEAASNGGATGLLAASRDKEGKNIFWYLKEILNSIRRRGTGGTTGRRPAPRSPRTGGGASASSSGDSSSETGGDGEDPDSIPDEVWEKINKDKEKERQEKEKEKALGNWVKDKFYKTKAGKAIYDGTTAVSTILQKPFEYATKLLNKADENMFNLMFGQNDLRDDEGNKIESVFSYIIYKIKKSFNDVLSWVKTKFNDHLKPLIDNYVKPVTDQVKEYAKAGFNRAKEGVKNTFGKGFSRLGEILNRGGVVGADDAAQAAVEESAYGRYVTKRGLTMISPGEVIIPASFDKSVQAKQLALEKRDKKSIFDSIGYNAKGTVDTEKIKSVLRDLYNDNKGNAKKGVAGGILGAGAGIVTGINPILGALAGSALSFISESESFKNFLFGEERDGSGVVPKKVYDFFKKNGSDMFDFGIAGGIAGLFTPFGVLGGAAIGAGIGYLKNSESFKKFVFGDAETGKDGLIKKETYDKFIANVKQHAPNILGGIGIGVLTGPFGLLGNAVMGAGLGMLSTTETFQNFMFGEKGNDGKRHGGLVGSFKDSVIEPAKEKVLEFAVSLKEYAQKNILDPMKRFWEPFNQAIKNTITNVGDSIRDHLNDMFEKTLGLPLQDFLQQKLFKPLTKVVGTILKAPVAVGKAIVAAPFRALGSIGDSMRMRQIQKGTAYNMSASARLAFRDQHHIRNAIGTALGRDKMLEQDTLLANMSEEDLMQLASLANAQINTREQISKNTGEAREAVGKQISKFFNTKTGTGTNLYDTFGYNRVKKLTEYAANGNMDKVESMLKKDKTLTQDQKNQLLDSIREQVAAAASAGRAQYAADMDETTRNMELERVLGRKFRGRKDARQVYRSAEAEIKARAKSRTAKEEETPEEAATNNLAELYKQKTDKLLDILAESNKYLKELAFPGSVKREDIDNAPKESEDKTTPGNGTAVSTAIATISKRETDEIIGIDPTTGLPITNNPDSKLNVENEKARADAESDDDANVEANKDTRNILQKMFDWFSGNKKGDKEKSNGILSKIGSMFSSLSGFLGIGGKVALGIAGVSLFGYATEWFKTSIWPSIKGALLGGTDANGETSDGLLTGVKNTLVGNSKTGEEGLLQKLFGWFGEKFESLKTWYTGKGGISGILVNDVMPKLITGFGYAVDNVVAPLTAMVIKSLPGIAVGLIKGIISGLKMAIFNKTLTRESKVDTGTSEVQSEIEGMSKSKSSALLSSMGSLGTSVKNAFETGSSSAAYTASSFASLDLSSLTNQEDANNQKTTLMDNLLGSTHRTNTLEYDEDGNIITQYTQMNSTDSALSALASSTARGFGNSLAGLSSSPSLLGKGLSKIKAGSKIGSGIIGLTTRGLSTAAKGAGTVLNAASKAGTTVRNAVRSAAGMTVDNVADAAASGAAKTATKAAANVAEEAAESTIKKGIVNGLKKIFDNIADSKIGSSIVGFVAKVTGQETTQAVVKNVLEKIGKALGEEIMSSAVGSAIKNIATAIAGFSPIGLLFIITDFWYGFDNADTILGVAKGDTEYSVGFAQKVLCGLLNVINEKITLGFIPTETIVDIIIDYLFPLFKLDATSLKEAQARAASVMDEYNLEHGTTYDNLEDFNNKDKFLTKVFGGIKNLGSNIVSGVKGIGTGIKNVGTSIGSGIKTAAGWVSDKASGLVSGAKNLITGGFDSVSGAVGTVVDNATSIGTFIKDVTSEVIKSATDPEYHWDINSYLDDEDPLKGAKSTLYNVMKVPLAIVGFISSIGSKVAGVIRGFTDKISTGLDEADQYVSAVKKGQYSIFNKQYWANDGEDDEENPLGTLSVVFSYISRIIRAPGAMLGYVGSKIKDIFNNMINGAKEGVLDAEADVKAVSSGQYTIFNKQYWSSDNTDEDNPLSKLGSVFGFINRLVNAPRAMLGYVGTKIKAGFNSLIDGAKEGVLDATADIEAVSKGQYTIFNKQYWSSENQDDDNPLTKIGSAFAFINRLVNAPRAMLGYVGTKIKEGFNYIVNNANEGAIDATENIDAVKRGQYTIFSKEYWSSASEGDNTNPLTKLGQVSAFITRLVNAPGAMIGYIGTKIKSGFTSMIEDVQNAQEDTDIVLERAEKGEISIFSKEYWTVGTQSDSALGILGTVSGYISRIINAPILLVKGLLNKVKEKFSGIIGWFKKVLGLEGDEATDFENEINSVTAGAGRGRRMIRAGMGHAYQSDASIANMRYGDSTIGDAGCGPVAATNLINSINGRMSVGQAARYAESHGKTVPGGGTDISYFNSILDSQGIPNRNTNNKANVLSALQQGNQVVMLGTDGTDYPGAPFGANPHFVTAKGVDANGNIIAEDPDLPQENAVYDKNTMLNSMITSVIAGKKRKGGKSRRVRFGRANTSTTAVPVNDGASTGVIKPNATAASTGTTAASTANGNNLGPNAIINVAKSQIGVCEKGSTNYVKYNNAYYGREVSGSSYPWCCVFVWWVFNQAGAADLFYGGGKTASCSTLRSYHWNAGQKVETPQAGDIVFFNFDGGTSTQHVGIVIGVNASGTVSTIEGNTSGSGSQSNGGCVMAKERNKKYIVGYYRPKYPYNYNASKVVDMSKWGDSTDYKSIAINGGQMTGDTVSFANSDTSYGATDGTATSESTSTGSLLTALSNLGKSILKAMWGADAVEALFGSSDTIDTSDDGGTTTPGDTGLTTYASDIAGSTDGQKIYNYLRGRGYSKAATSGIMGNLNAESGLRSNNLQNSYEKSLGMNDTQYTSAVNNRSYNKNNFINDSAGYGLAQWTYSSRKKGLYEASVDQGKSISDLGVQLPYLDKELNSYGLTSKIKNNNSVNEVSDTILRDFEKPANLNYNARRQMSQAIYNQYALNEDEEAIANGGTVQSSDTTSTTTATKPSTTNSANTNTVAAYGRGRGVLKTGLATKALSKHIRSGGAGTGIIDTDASPAAGIASSISASTPVDYGTFLQTIVTILMSIADNTAVLSKILSVLSDNFDIKIDKGDIDAAHQETKLQTEAALNDLVTRSASNNRNLSKLLNNKDTNYILSAMTAIASE